MIFKRLNRPLQRLYSGGGHGTNEPGGYLFGEAPGVKRSWYWWEPTVYIGCYGGTAAFLVALYFSPKKSSVELAREEAKRRLAERGETFGWPLPPDYKNSK